MQVTAILVEFEDLSPDEARVCIQKALDDKVLNARITDHRVYDPEHGGVCIYQP